MEIYYCVTWKYIIGYHGNILLCNMEIYHCVTWNMCRQPVTTTILNILCMHVLYNINTKTCIRWGLRLWHSL